MGVQNGAGERLFSVPFAGIGAFSEIDDDWTIDLTTATIDLTTFIGGRVDGIAIENDRDYLIWAFLDDNQRFAGIGATRKPYSTFTSAAAGAKGASFVVTVTNGFQFTIGARVVLRNNRGTAPVNEWNWGTITAQANTSLTVLLDNNTYGTAFTTTGGGDGGVVQQWNSFRPWVVTTTGQTLYKNHYSLLGECSTNSTVITFAYKLTDEYRWMANTVFYSVTGTAAGGTTLVSLGRFIPLWATKFNALAEISAAGVNDTIAIQNLFTSANHVISVAQTAGTATQYDSGPGQLARDAEVNVVRVRTSSASTVAYINGYYVSGGMRR
jgi:hypothetical protein